MSDEVNYDVTNPEEAADIKAAAAALAGSSWQANLWDNVTQAINWANQIPVSQPGEIVFNIRDNGQVWTYTFV
jgi:hypothetical protein